VSGSRIGFHLDEHIPRAVADALRRRSIDVLTTSEAGMFGMSDVEHLAHALSDGRVLVTQDSDFLRLHEQGYAHAGIAYCAQGTRTIGHIVSGLVLIHELLTRDEMLGRVEFL
jgi:hypothetical protein